MCIMCEIHDKTINHLFFMCTKTSKIWKMYNVWIGIQLVHRNRANDHFLGFELARLSIKNNYV